MTYFFYDGWVYSAIMTDWGLAVYNPNGQEIFDLEVVEAGYEAYERKVA